MNLRDSASYDLNKSIRNIVIDGSHVKISNRSISFLDVNNFENFAKYVKYTLLPSLYPNYDIMAEKLAKVKQNYSDEIDSIFSSDFGYLISQDIRLIGVLRFRQIRNRDSYNVNDTYGPMWIKNKTNNGIK